MVLEKVGRLEAVPMRHTFTKEERAVMPEEAAFADELAETLCAAEDAADDEVERVGKVEGVVDVGDTGEAAGDESDGGAAETEAVASRSRAAARARQPYGDPLYGTLPIARWAEALLALEPFARLSGVSLSDAPGALLLRRPFPSRRAHSVGVYALARQARPRDRALQAAALAHDLGHGPFSHLTEPLMIERLGMDHEQRGAALLRQTLAGLTGASARLLAWLDVDEVAALILGDGPDGRGKLLNGLLDYDNLDNVARFLQAAELGVPSYDPRTLARELRLAPPSTDAASGETLAPYVALPTDAAAQAQAWLADRRRVYRFLGESARNLAIRGMLRKAVDLATRAGLIGPGFFDATDAQALGLLRSGYAAGSAPLAEAVINDHLYVPAWEATAPESADAITELFARWDTRLAIEDRLATEAALLPHEVVLSFTVERGERALPPLIVAERGRAEPVVSEPLGSDQSVAASEPERRITLFVTRTVGRDYMRRARMAAERALGGLGAIPRVGSDLH